MKHFLRYVRIWKKLTLNSFLTAFVSRFGAAVFLIAKLLRFIFFLIFLYLLFGRVPTLSGYTLNQALLFFLTFTVVDTGTQLLFREVYRFRHLVVTGDFDLVLAKPISPLFRSLVGGTDPLDLVMFIPYVVLLGYLIVRMSLLDIWTLTLYVSLLGNSFLIAMSFHILVLSLAILTTEIDHTIFIYRDLISMGRIPTDIYREPVRSVITYIIPVGFMMTVPAKALLGLLTPTVISIGLTIGVGFFLISIFLWRFSLRRYASASS
jgi:ABC-2 type transport system permease protein